MTTQSSAAPSGNAQHALGRLWCDPSRLGKSFRLVVGALVVILGLTSLRLRIGTFIEPYIYLKDIIQEYLTAKAVAEGIDPYLSTGTLAARYLNLSPLTTFVHHPTPHPPPTAILFLPLSLLDYPTATLAWLGLELVFLVSSVYLLGLVAGIRLSPLSTTAISLALFAAYPFAEDVTLGQLMLMLLLLLAGALVALCRHQALLGGGLLGIAMLVKPIAWPLLLLLALRRDWRALAAAVSTVALGYTIAAWFMGFTTIITYFRDVLPAVNGIYKAAASNISLWSFGWRVFEGSGSPVWGGAYGIVAPPLVPSPSAAAIVSAALPALVLLTTCYAVRNERSIYLPFGLMVGVSILISPISWGHYLVLAAIPAAQVIGWLRANRLPANETSAAMLVAVLVLLSTREWAALAYLITGQKAVDVGQPVLPFAPTLLTLMPAATVCLLCWLLFSLNRKTGQQAARPATEVAEGGRR